MRTPDPILVAGDPAVVEAYFDLLQETITMYKIIPQNIYNMDKTGFLIGQSQSHNIIVPKENRVMDVDDQRRFMLGLRVAGSQDRKNESLSSNARHQA